MSVVCLSVRCGPCGWWWWLVLFPFTFSLVIIAAIDLCFYCCSDPPSPFFSYSTFSSERAWSSIMCGGSARSSRLLIDSFFSLQADSVVGLPNINFQLLVTHLQLSVCTFRHSSSIPAKQRNRGCSRSTFYTGPARFTHA